MVQASKNSDTRLKRHSADRPRAVQLDPSEVQVRNKAIAHRAYELYERRGGGHGRDWEDWFQAEQEVRTGTMIES